jgi:alanine racemase
VIASIKANAYGHGAVPVARVLAREGAFALATASLDDALAVRAAGIDMPVVALGGWPPETAGTLLANGLVPTVHDRRSALAVSAAAARPTAVWVKVDAGLGRLGVPLEDAEAFVHEVAALPSLLVEGLYTHLPFVDAAGREWARESLGAFAALTARLRATGLALPVVQALSSAGIAAGLDDGGCTAVCPGHLLYGVPPAAADVVDASAFRPVLRAVRTRLAQVTLHPYARRAGLGGARSLAAGAVTGVVPFGRYQGHRPARDAVAVMLVRGRRVPVTGVSLEHSTLDLTGLADAAAGEDVVVLGEQAGERLALADLAAWQGVTAGDVLMSLDRRLETVYVGGEPG